MTVFPSSLLALVADSPVVVEAYDTSTPVFAAYVDRVEGDLASADIGNAPKWTQSCGARRRPRSVCGWR